MKKRTNLRRKAIAIIALFATLLSVLFSLSSCSSDKNKKSKTFYGYFDTVCTVYSYDSESNSEFEENCDKIEEILSTYHKLFDIYNEYEGIKNIATLNKNAGKGPLYIDGKLVEFLVFAKEMYTVSLGETNIAMGGVLKLWHNCRENALKDEDNADSAKLPDSSALEEASKHTDINSLLIDIDEGTAEITDSLMSLDVGAVGKGFATEKVRKMLVNMGVGGYVLNFGGSITAIGEKKNGKGWTTGIVNPDLNSKEKYSAKITLKNTNLVTSGSYERFYTVDGISYHHVIDKDTLYPTLHFASVSVMGGDCGLLDGLSTALMCMDLEKGKEIAKKYFVDVMWIDFDGNIEMTDGFKKIKN